MSTQRKIFLRVSNNCELVTPSKMFFKWKFFVLVIIHQYVCLTWSAKLKCNGFEELCDLSIDQVTFPGTHNSGAGFDSHLRYHTFLGKVLAVSCWYRNQKQSIYGQLELGIRYFDIDACWQDAYNPKGAWVCHNGAYGGSLLKMFQQVDNWMKQSQNRNEVIVLHFNRDFEKENPERIGANILQLLKSFWLRGDMRSLSIQPNPLSTTLRESINSNRRIHVIGHTSLMRDSIVMPDYLVGYTWTSMTYIESNGCADLIKKMSDKRCTIEAYHTFVRYDMYLSSGMCVHDMASSCRPLTRDGVRGCFSGTRNQKKTVNFILVDYATTTVVDVAREQNVRNIKMYLGKNVV